MAARKPARKAPATPARPAAAPTAAPAAAPVADLFASVSPAAAIPAPTPAVVPTPTLPLPLPLPPPAHTTTPAPVATPAPVPAKLFAPGEVPFTALTTTIKGGITAELGPVTFFVGPNRTGKTRALDAARLALTGRHPIGTKGELLALADGNSLLASLVGPKAACRFEIPAGTRTGQHTLTGAIAGLDPVLFTPLDNVATLVAMGEARARESFFARFGDGRDALAAPTGLDTAQVELWQEGLVGIGAGDWHAGEKARRYVAKDGVDPATKLSELAGWLRREKLRIGRDIRSLEEESARRRAEILAGGAVTDEAITAAAKKAEEAAAWEKLAATRARREEVARDLEALLVQARARIEVALPPERDEAGEAARAKELETARTQVEATMQACREATQVQMQIALVLAARKVQASQPGAPCLCCLQPLPAGTDPAVGIRSATEFHTQALTTESAAKAAVVAATIELHKLEKADLDAKGRMKRVYDTELASRTQFAQTIGTLQQNIAGLDAVLAQAGAATDPGVAADAARAEHERLVQAQTALRSLEEQSVRVRKLDWRQTVCKTLEKAAATKLQTLCEKARAGAEGAVNHYMPAGLVAYLVLEDGDGVAFRWEVQGRDGTTHRRGAACGAEWGTFQAAYACAWSEGSPLRVVIVDDADLAAFDPATLGAFVQVLQARVADGTLSQVVGAWNRPRELPENCTIVRCE